jgi:hypothetical protein
MESERSNHLRDFTVSQLLSNYAAILEELRARGVVRTSNNPLSDYGELLFCRAFGWTLASNSAAGHDAKCQDGVRYQIKARRMTKYNGSRQLSALRNLDKDPFDQLAGVLVDAEFRVIKAVLVPVEIVRVRSKHIEHTNSWKFMLTDDVWKLPGVLDVTEPLRHAATTI